MLEIKAAKDSPLKYQFGGVRVPYTDRATKVWRNDDIVIKL